MNKNIITLAIALLVLVLAPNAHATIDDDVWSYVFHLQVKNGVLAQNSDAEFFYDPVPGEFTAETKESGEYYAEIISGKGIMLNRTWFSAPNTVVVSQNKKILDVRVPFFANADHVTFYNSNNKSLFTHSLRGSSFCNDDNKCNAEVGENYRNCANDCPVPQTPTEPTPVQQKPTEQQLVTPPPSIIAEENIPPDEETEKITRVTTPVDKKGSVIPLTVGVFLILAGVVGLFYLRGKRGGE